jgi:hypothetical protein
MRIFYHTILSRQKIYDLKCVGFWSKMWVYVLGEFEVKFVPRILLVCLITFDIFRRELVYKEHVYCVTQKLFEFSSHIYVLLSNSHNMSFCMRITLQLIQTVNSSR